MQKMNDCCCELKERISNSENSTKELIKSIETERIRNALQACETKNLMYEMSRFGFHGHHGSHHGGNGNGNGN